MKVYVNALQVCVCKWLLCRCGMFEIMAVASGRVKGKGWPTGQRDRVAVILLLYTVLSYFTCTSHSEYCVLIHQ